MFTLSIELAFIMKGSVLRLQLLVAAISLLLIATTESSVYRLNRDVLPSFYNLTINVNEGKNFKLGNAFVGEVAITLQTSQSDIYEITLHKDALDISSCLLYNKDGRLQQNDSITSLKFDQESQQLTVPLVQPLTVNENYTLYLQYTGVIRANNTGLSTKWRRDDFVFTHLEPYYARTVFPCFDEPTFKAKFQLHISRPSGYNAISNTRLIKTTNEGHERFVDHFDVTPIMSTYLLAFTISKNQIRGNLSEFAVLSLPEYYNYTAFSYKVGKRFLEAYSKQFQLQLEKGALLATASWTDYNAIQNLGIISFSDETLIHIPGYTDGNKNKELTCRMISHELALLWFGNSINLSWLNEAFARYYEIYMANKLYTEYYLDKRFGIEYLQTIFEKDAVATSHPLTIPKMTVHSYAQIYKKSKDITNDKGASIIRMWRNIMGEDNFSKSITSYLKQYHLKNVQPSDLFAHLKQNWPAQPKVDLDTFFSDFTEQVGYPMVIVNITEDNKRVILHQKRFLSNPEDGSDATLRYTIPITFTTNMEHKFNNLTPHSYFDKNMNEVEISFNEPIDWIVLNLKQSNYYRVFYDKRILTQIKLALTTYGRQPISVESRAQIIDDLFNFAHAGMMDYAEVFEFMEYLCTETDYIPWYAAYHGMERVIRRLTPQQLPHFEKYLRNITSLVFSLRTPKTMRWDGVLNVYNRDLQVSWLCKYQNADCNNQVKLLFEGNFGTPSPDYRETVYCAASRTTAHPRIWHLYHNENNTDEKNLLLRAISCTRDYKTYLKFELFHLLPNRNRGSGLMQIYQQNPDLITPILTTIIENIGEISGRLYEHQIVEVLEDFVDYFTTRDQEKLFSDLIDKISHFVLEDTVKKLRTFQTKIRNNLQWAEQRLEKLVNYLEKRNKTPAPLQLG